MLTDAYWSVCNLALFKSFHWSVFTINTCQQSGTKYVNYVVERLRKLTRRRTTRPFGIVRPGPYCLATISLICV